MFYIYPNLPSLPKFRFLTFHFLATRLLANVTFEMVGRRGGLVKWFGKKFAFKMKQKADDGNCQVSKHWPSLTSIKFHMVQNQSG
ncbi:hypothetical protein MTR_2g009900 [Medicago truncatula]|uniref:Uncharacterized protein n=1 Tax=Medicago truncatula TaxID=3880 RepID=G7IS86_MEDTR|nr:hypothetical protein MTR_2g009900 [Medicago truncatula]